MKGVRPTKVRRLGPDHGFLGTGRYQSGTIGAADDVEDALVVVPVREGRAVDRRREASLARSRGEPSGDRPEPDSAGEGKQTPVPPDRVLETLASTGMWEPSWEPSAVDPSGSLWAPVDSKPAEPGSADGLGRPWPPIGDLRIRRLRVRVAPGAPVSLWRCYSKADPRSPLPT
jgi:hypothetical protein